MINPFKSKKGLGRGLSSLIGDSEKIYDKTCPGSRAYFSFTEEFLNQDKPVESAAWLIRSNQKKDLEEDCLPW